jgi:hypothetical protein
MMTFTVMPGKQFQDGEKVDNDKLNLLGRPTVEVEDGLDALQAETSPWFIVRDSGSVVNAYVGREAAPEMDPAGGVLLDGSIVAFRVPITNTAASTFRLLASSGTALTGPASILSRGRPVHPGELLKDRFIEMRWEATSATWQLTSGGASFNAADLVPAPAFLGTDDTTTASTALAYSLRFSPAPLAPFVAGLRIQFKVPITNADGVTLQLKDGAGAAVGGVIAIQRSGRVGAAMPVEAGCFTAGRMAELVFDGTVWQLAALPPPDMVTSGITGLTVKNNGTAKVDVTAGELVVAEPGGNGAVRILTSVAVTADIAVTGVNGFDTAAPLPPAAGWIYVFVIHNPSTAATAGLLSISQNAPTMPAGYTHRLLVGSIQRTASVFIETYQSDRRVWLAPQAIFTGRAGVTSYTALSGSDLIAFQAAIPPLAKVAIGVMGTNTASAQIAVAGTASGLGECVFAAGDDPSGIVAGFKCGGSFRVPMPTPQLIYWKQFDTEVQNRLTVTGYEY